jgi:5-formyltetrahydrofolate cyclo-ligase
MDGMLAQAGGFSRQRQGCCVPDSPVPTGFAGLPAWKAALRAEVLASRRARDLATRAASAARVQAAVRRLLTSGHPAPAGSLVAAYVPTGPEPGGSDLPVMLREALPPPVTLLLPVLREDLDLDWAAYDGRLVTTARGLREPPGPRLGVTAIATAALVLVPAVAVDRRGVRLGRGGGSFDRALARVPPGVPVVALLHDGELRDRDLPCEPHDRRVTAVITPAAGVVYL